MTVDSLNFLGAGPEAGAREHGQGPGAASMHSYLYKEGVVWKVTLPLLLGRVE